MSDQSSQNSAPSGNEGTTLSNMVSGKTSGVQGIEAAYNRAGASDHHTPGYAGQLGSKGSTPTSGGSQSNEVRSNPLYITASE